MTHHTAVLTADWTKTLGQLVERQDEALRTNWFQKFCPFKDLFDLWHEFRMDLNDF